MRTVNILKDVKKFDNKRKYILLSEKSLAEKMEEKTNVEMNLQTIIKDNVDLELSESVLEKTKDFIISKFKYFIVVMDYFLSYTVLSYYGDSLNLPVWIKALVTIIVITVLEYLIGLFKEKKVVFPQGKDKHNPFAYDENQVQAIEEYNQKIKKTRRSKVLTYVFICALPLISLITMFQELGNAFLISGLEDEISYTSVIITSEIIAIVIRYLGLALLCFSGHYFLTENSDKILEARARNITRKKLEEKKNKLELIKEEIKELENRIINALMDFHQSLKLHLAKFGKHTMLPLETFSPMLDQLYLRLNGLYLTK